MTLRPRLSFTVTILTAFTGVQPGHRARGTRVPQCRRARRRATADAGLAEVAATVSVRTKPWSARYSLSSVRWPAAGSQSKRRLRHAPRRRCSPCSKQSRRRVSRGWSGGTGCCCKQHRSAPWRNRSHRRCRTGRLLSCDAGLALLTVRGCTDADEQALHVAAAFEVQPRPCINTGLCRSRSPRKGR